MARVMVTGGAGFIGSHVVDALLGQGHAVSIVDNLSTGRRENLNPGASFYQVDITDAAALEAAYREARPQVVSHHAAQTDVRRSMADPAFDACVNVVGTLNVLRLAAEHGAERVIFSSTCAVYAEPQYVPMDEAHPLGPQSGYGISKRAAEGYFGVWAASKGLKYKVFRYGNVFGPRQNPAAEAGVVAIFAGLLLSGRRATIFGDGSKTRDYIFVEDIVRGNLLALGEAGDGEVMNLARGEEVTDFRVFDEVRRALGVDAEPAYAPKRPGEADHVGLDASKARRLLGWEPRVSFAEGVALTVASLRGGRRP